MARSRRRRLVFVIARSGDVDDPTCPACRGIALVRLGEGLQVCAVAWEDGLLRPLCPGHVEELAPLLADQVRQQVRA